jgi:hypothetical protein
VTTNNAWTVYLVADENDIQNKYRKGSEQKEEEDTLYARLLSSSSML